MISELLLLVVILWVFSISVSNQVQTIIPQVVANKTTTTSDDAIAKSLKEDVDKLLSDFTFRPTYHITISNKGTYVKNKKFIYLQIRDNKGNLFNRDTLFSALIHEMAHILCYEAGHTAAFIQVEQRLIRLGQQMRLFDPMNVDSAYINVVQE